MTHIVELHNISKHYGLVVGVDGIDLSIRDGEFLTLLGPSGCGKSTLLRMIGGFETPTSGSIRIAKRDVTHVPPQRRDVNMMFQDYALFPHMSVGRNITYGLERKGISGAAAVAKAESALDLVGLSGMFDRRPHALSGGQRQRVALARAIVREPKVILLDEPLSALDAKLREQMQVELKHMHAKLGITFIMVTHDQTEALVMSDRVIVMDKGRIAQDGTPQDIYERPASPYVANFIGTTNIFPAGFISRGRDQIVLRAAGVDICVDASAMRSTNVSHIGVRPEKACLLRNGQARTANILAGTVAETIYHGVALRTVIRLQTGEDFMVEEMLGQGIGRAAPRDVGEPVEIGIEPHNILVFGLGG